MTEETKTETKKHELIEQARAEREALQKENERMENNLKELRELEASRLLSGSAGGRVEPTPPKEETDQDYAKRLISKPYGDKKIETPEQ